MLPTNNLPRGGKDAAAQAEQLKSVRAVIALMDELAKVMHEEAELLTGQDFAAQRELLTRKQRLTLDYRATMKNLAAQPELLKTAPEDMRAAVRAGAQRLADLAEVNARSLRGAMMAVQRLLQSIVQIVKDETQPQNGYGNLKNPKMRMEAYSPICAPVTVNRTA